MLTRKKGDMRMSRFFIMLILLGLGTFVLATTPVWVGSDVDYMVDEDSVYYHNLSANISGFNNDIEFAFDTDNDINWTNASGTYSVSPSAVSAWINIYDSSTGNLTINASYDNQSGFFIIPIQATNTTDEEFSGTNFEFQVNATNDAPNFTDLVSNYTFSQEEHGSYTVNAADEEEHYPLSFNLTFLNNCTHASWSGRNPGENCSVFNLTSGSDTSTVFDFTPTRDEVGIYWANLTVSDFNGTCPHAYCDASTYEVNKTSAVYLVKFEVLSSFSLNVTNCTGISVTEGEAINCTIEVTTVGEDDELNFSSYAFFSDNPSKPYDNTNRDWLYGDNSGNATNFSYSIPISVVPSKEEVGNWTINFTVWDVLRSDSKVREIEIFVNYTESNVSLESISDRMFYEDSNFDVTAYDDDLLIWDTALKDETLTFTSNTTWAVPSTPSDTPDGNNYSTSSVFVNHTQAVDSVGLGNYSVLINVSDDVGNWDSQVVIVGIWNDTAPEWNSSLSDPVVLQLTEEQLFSYNVSVNVSDPGESVSFYYENLTEEFCSLNSTNFNSNGMINFTPTDCDVGFHNVSIIASNGKLNSSWSFVFNVSNVYDAPSIFSFTGDNGTQEDLDEGFNFVVQERMVVNFSLDVEDEDFLIPDGQRANYYNESLDIEVVFRNSTGSIVEDLFNFSFVEFHSVGSSYLINYNATFEPNVSHVGNYTVFVNISDGVGNSTNRTWFLNVTEIQDPPVLGNVSNHSLTIHDVLNFSLNATDDEDDFNNLSLTYSVLNLSVGAPNLTVTNNVVSFNMSSNSSYAGEWNYNVTVNDSDSMVDWQIFYVSVYGYANLSSPNEDAVFNLTENVTGTLNFTISHAVGDNLTYEFWIDNVSCPLFQNNTNCSYGNFSFRELMSGAGDGSVLEWNFTPDFSDETYGLLKNLTVSVYPNSSELDSNQSESVAANFSFKLNISHANAPMRAVNPLGKLTGNYGSAINVDLEGYFVDEDVSDPYYSQNVTFSKSSGHANIFVLHSSGWNIQVIENLGAAFSGFIDITGDDNVTSDVIEDVEVEFTAPTVRQTSGGGSSTKVKFFSIRIVMPEDVIISEENYIEVPFALENSGGIDLRGIDLSSQVLYNNQFTEGIRIDLGDTYVDELKIGERKEYSMKIYADTNRSGKYKATIFANITSPKFSDWGEFFIDLRRINETEAEKLLIFTEKIIAENPECLELTEIFRRAKEAFEVGNYEESMSLAQETIAACEDMISATEQIKYKIEGFIERNFYYISFVTLMIFVAGFGFYIYKRVRFNKSVEDNYNR